MNHTSRPGDVADPWYTGEFEATWQEVPEGCTAVGIRAHDFAPCAPAAPNALPVQLNSTSENPFDWNLIFTAPDGTTRLWWKVSKTNLTAASPEAPAFLGTAPQNIMPLG